MIDEIAGQQPVVVMKLLKGGGAKGHSLYSKTCDQSVKEAVGKTD